MSVAWTTILIIVLLLPGVGFFAGYWSQERYSREIVKSAAIGEVGMAVFMALVLHLAGMSVVQWLGVDLPGFFQPLSSYDQVSHGELLRRFFDWLWPASYYALAITAAGFLFGRLIAYMVMFGWLRSLASHGWAYDLIKEKSSGIVTTYVMTNLVENNRVLMYAGHLEDFYLGPDGCFAYVVLKNCSRYFMNIDGGEPTTTQQMPLFRNTDGERRWEHLVLSGANISNVLFDPIGHVAFQRDAAAEAELHRAVEALLEKEAAFRASMATSPSSSFR